MKKILETLLVSVVTIFGMGMIGCPLSTSFATLIAYVGFTYIVDEAVNHIKEKSMPVLLEWLTYSFALIATFLCPAGIMYSKIYVFIFGLIFVVASLVCNVINKKRLN